MIDKMFELHTKRSHSIILILLFLQLWRAQGFSGSKAFINDADHS